jgi:hypothetical protein
MALVFWATAEGRPVAEWFSRWVRWDAIWYETIWREGYTGRVFLLAFPPGFSVIVGTLSWLLQTPFHFVATNFNLLCYLCTCALLANHLSSRFGVPRAAVFIFVLSSPVSYFAFAPYSDVPLFGLLTALIVLDSSIDRRVRRETYWLAFLLMVVVPWVRLTGYGLAAWLLLRRSYALGAIVALAGWLIFNYLVAGDPVQFLRAQREFLMPEGFLLDGMSRAAARLIPRSWPMEAENQIRWLQFNLLPLLYFAALLAAAAWYATRAEYLLAVTIVSMLLLSHNQAFWRSAVRYDLPLIPFLCVPILSGAHTVSAACRYTKYAVYTVVVVLQFSLQLVFARQFHRGGWGF